MGWSVLRPHNYSNVNTLFGIAYRCCLHGNAQRRVCSNFAGAHTKFSNAQVNRSAPLSIIDESHMICVQPHSIIVEVLMIIDESYLICVRPLSIIVEVHMIIDESHMICVRPLSIIVEVHMIIDESHLICV